MDNSECAEGIEKILRVSASVCSCVQGVFSVGAQGLYLYRHI
jgi:hypothetical protein